MANSYFTASLVDIPIGTRARSQQIDDISLAVEEGFNKIPSEIELLQIGSMLGVDTGTANTYVVSRTNTVTSIDNGLEVWFLPLTANTTVSTLAVDGLASKAISRLDGGDTIIGDIVAGKWLGAKFNSGTDTYDIVTPSPGTLAALENLYNDFNKRYLGSKSTAPAFNNSGDALEEGVMYFNTSTHITYVWDSVTWAALNQYVKYIDDAPPSSPYDGQEWLDTNTGIDYTYYVDEDLTGQWLQQPFMVAAEDAIVIETSSTMSTTSLTSSGTVDTEVNLHLIDSTAGDVTLTLPTAVGSAGVNVHLTRVDTSSNDVVIDTTLSQTINSNTDVQLTAEQSILVVSDGTNWRIL